MMRKIFALLAILVILGALAACAAGQSPQQSLQEEQPDSGASGDTPSSSSAASGSEESGPEADGTQTRILVAYFSATGNTEGVAQRLAEVLGAELYEIVPEQPYTSEDLDYTADGCRAQQEQDDPAARPAIIGSLEGAEDPDVVFLGYPIWWGQAPKILYTFLEENDFGDATIVPFCTSGSSAIGSSADALQALTQEARWLPGQRFAADASAEELAEWVQELGLDTSDAAAQGEEQEETRLRLTFEGGEALVVLEDNATAQDFLSMLPATFTFEDYAGSEKISYLPRALSTQGAPESFAPEVGDVALYVPWGDLAIFYGAASASSDLVPMGHVETGLELLSDIEGAFEVDISVVG